MCRMRIVIVLLEYKVEGDQLSVVVAGKDGYNIYYAFCRNPADRAGLNKAVMGENLD